MDILVSHVKGKAWFWAIFLSQKKEKRKTESQFGVVFLKNQTIQKFYIHSDGCLTETACNPQFKLKVTKITLLAFSVQIKNVLKHLCPCGETQAMFHIVESCPLTKLNGGLSRLHSADEDTVSWLTSYGSWHAYEKKNTETEFSIHILECNYITCCHCCE